MCNLPINLHDDAGRKIIVISEKEQLSKQKNPKSLVLLAASCLN
jgi:hypothetical protein